MRIWLNAARPHPSRRDRAGSGRYRRGDIRGRRPAAARVFLAALAASVMIQIGTNLANDYSDARRGADSL